MLEIENLCVSYDGTNRVLDGINLEIHASEIVIIGGRTGSGKSTLARCASGFIIPESVQSMTGEIRVDGQSVFTTRTSALAKKVALIQQDVESQICTLRVVDEIAFGPENFLLTSDEIQSIISESLQSVGALDLYNRPTHALSGGEKQRIVIASMLASRPDYIVLDEPTSSLDPKGANSLTALLSQLRKEGIGILCFEHNITRLASIADRILKMDQGQLVSQSRYELSTPTFEKPRIQTSEQYDPLLKATNLSFSYGERVAVNNVSVEFSSGEIVAIMGDNGSGKSTILGLLSGLLTPKTGEVFLEGKQLNETKREQLAREISVVFQNPNHQIFERTVWKDQVLGIDLLSLNPEEYLASARRLLEEAQLSEKLEQNPFTLSFGQKRRLNITSTSYYCPKIYLFDEPFIGQDHEGIEFIITQIFDAQRAGSISIIATHDPWFVSECCTRVLFMRKGSILVDGKPDTVFSWLKTNGEPYYTDIGGGP